MYYQLQQQIRTYMFSDKHCQNSHKTNQKQCIEYQSFTHNIGYLRLFVCITCKDFLVLHSNMLFLWITDGLSSVFFCEI